jgi:hypothetical protein
LVDEECLTSGSAEDNFPAFTVGLSKSQLAREAPRIERTDRVH